jgi:hypothetical protein
MRKVHEKSIVLGIGIGMIITAIAGMIFSAGNTKELSKAEIISMAKGYGLIEQVQFLDGDNASKDSTKVVADSTVTNSTIANSTSSGDSATDSTKPAVDSGANAAELTDKPQSSSGSNSTSDRNIIIEINYGYKSQDIIDQLLEKGVISNREDFTAVLDSYQATTKIRVGTFKFKKNDDLDYIVKTICKLK